MSNYLQAKIFPKIVAYATHPVHISALILLGVALMLLGNVLWFELIGGNYTNVTSAAVSCIVLLQQIAHHQENQSHQQTHTRDIAALHAKVDTLTTGGLSEPALDHSGSH